VEHERAGAAADAGVHISDSLKNNIGRARAAAIRAVWLNREGLCNSGELSPDAETSGLDAVPAALAALDGD
jgi:FMN phosphatase YigB (HAD superfamily)